MKRVALILVILLLFVLSAGYLLQPVLAPDFTLPHLGKSPAQSVPDASSPEPDSSAADSDVFAPAGSHAADKRIAAMSLEEKVGQLFFARCPDTGAIDTVQTLYPGGYLLFARDFEDKTPAEAKETIAAYQAASKTPLLIGVDEEGGDVVRVSKFTAYRRWPFQSPQELFDENGMEAFVYDTAEKDQLLKSLGINVNLAPVCDVSTDESDFIYPRTFGQDADATAVYVEAVVARMSRDGMGAVLKHFPGYGPNDDTHTGVAVDSRSMDAFMNSDFLPFVAGIEAGAGGVLISHNIVSCMDETLPASLSPEVHSILRNTVDFGGVVMTDDLAMDAIGEFADVGQAAVLAVQAGNDLLITSDLETQYRAVLAAVQEGTLTEAQINECLRRIFTWKAELGLIEIEE